VAELDDAGHLRLARRLLGDTSRRSTDVEGSQRELRSRLADRLRGDDADGLADVDHFHDRQIPPVAHAAQTAFGLARQHRSDTNRLDAGVLDLGGRVFVNELPRLDQQAAATRLVELMRVLDVLAGDRTDDPLGERLDDVLAFLQRGDLVALDRAAILLADSDILRAVDATTRQIAGVRRL